MTTTSIQSLSMSIQDAAAVLDELLSPPGMRDPVRPLLALEEHESRFELRAQLPAVRPEELHIVAGEDFLELEAAVRRPPRFRCCLVPGGSELRFARRYPLASAIVPERVNARLDGGELRLWLPKRAGPRRSGAGRVVVPVSE